jgi:hypothetical protein
MAREPEEREAPNAPEASFSLEVGPVEEFPRDAIEPEMLRQFAAYAGSSSWGQWVQLGSYPGGGSFDINYRAVRGDTVVWGAVNYYGSGGSITEVFKDSISRTTGNAWAAIWVCFHGNPYGSAVRGTLGWG